MNLQTTDACRLIDTTLENLGISQVHPADCHEETDFWLNNDGLDDPCLIDLTHLPFVTIDNAQSRDLDQALMVEQHDSNYRALYALADASYYVQPGSALFTEALRRGASFYAPDRAVPMLPRALSEGLISLNPDVDRRALVFDIRLTNDAQVESCYLMRARIRSRAKLDYQGVQAWLDTGVEDTQPYARSLRLLKSLGSRLIDAGAERGVIAFDRQDSRVQLTQDNKLNITIRHRVQVEGYNEQMSLLCNMQGAQMLMGFAGVTDVVQAVYRVHEAPLAKRLARLKKTLAQFAAHQNNPDLWVWQDNQSLASYVAALPDKSEFHTQVRAVQRQIMRTQSASSLEPEPGMHHALKVASYARFSSPMREIVGIYTHKELLEALGGKAWCNVHDQKLREQVIDSATQARHTQRKLDRKIHFHALAMIFQQDLSLAESPWRNGTIMGLRPDRVYVQLDDMAVEIKIYQPDLQAQYETAYIIDNVLARPAKPGRPGWILGQGVRVSVHSFDTERQRYRFLIAPASV